MSSRSIGIALSVEKGICCQPPTAQIHSSHRTSLPPYSLSLSRRCLDNLRLRRSSPGEALGDPEADETASDDEDDTEHDDLLQHS